MVRPFFLCLVSLALTAAGLSSNRLMGQAAIGNLSNRPFVVGIIPVVGPNGAVGGVSVDAQGILDRADLETQGRLRHVRADALKAVSDDLSRPCKLRKISLRALDALLARHAETREPLPDEVLYLAGLLRVEYVIAYPERQDIVLAGPAEGWRISENGSLVGRQSGEPVLQLQDLLVALRTADPPSAAGITCSIDPTAEGVARLNRLTRRRGFQVTQQSVAQMEKTLGPQQITLTGVPDTSRFARVMVAADFAMKRLAMGLESPPAPVELSSYLKIVADSGGRPAAMPRWWLAPKYEALLHDEQGLTWRLQGATVEVKTDGDDAKSDADLRRRAPATHQWADAMTQQYRALSRSMPVFADLRNCMDWAVVGALIQWQQLRKDTGAALPTLYGTLLQPAPLNVPKQVASTASLIRQGRGWIVSVSGGVQVDGWTALRTLKPDPQLSQLRASTAGPASGKWWWD